MKEVTVQEQVQIRRVCPVLGRMGLWESEVSGRVPNTGLTIRKKSDARTM